MQGILEMHDIPTMRDVSAFTMVRNLIIGSAQESTKNEKVFVNFKTSVEANNVSRR